MNAISEPPTKRMRLAYHHQHKINHAIQDVPPHEPSLLPLETVDKLVVDSLKTICEEEAQKQGISDPIIESIVMEALRNAAEECRRSGTSYRILLTSKSYIKPLFESATLDACCSTNYADSDRLRNCNRCSRFAPT